ncbi:MAG: hypothetical protein JWM57_3247, partial [Phycisphaerales bacterium]|nr:hypothetical protein [Phycisphaerales bacterium]
MTRFLAVAAACVLGVSLSAPADTLDVPLMSGAPTVDGKIDPAEWAGAARLDGFTTGERKLEWRSIHTYIGATADTLYVAIQSKLPDDGPLLNVVDHDGLKVVYDDSVEVWIDPQPEVTARVEYQMIANPGGHAGFATQIRGKATEDINWNGAWPRASSQAGGYWNFECAIPIASMSHAGPGRKTTDGTWLLNLCRNWRRPWADSSFAGGKYRWSGPTLRFTHGGPVVRQIVDGDPTRPQGGAALHLSVRNPDASPIQVKALLNLTRNNMPTVKQEQTLSLDGGEEKTLDIALDANDPTTIADLNASVTSTDGKTTSFARTLQWSKSAAAHRWD